MTIPAEGCHRANSPKASINVLNDFKNKRVLTDNKYQINFCGALSKSKQSAKMNNFMIDDNEEVVNMDSPVAPRHQRGCKSWSEISKASCKENPQMRARPNPFVVRKNQNFEPKHPNQIHSISYITTVPDASVPHSVSRSTEFLAKMIWQQHKRDNFNPNNLISNQH